MIIRKPYAFLIKNFKKIHILLLLISLFVLYRLFDVGNFVKEYMSFGTYDAYLNPITKHITFWLLLGIFVLVVGTASLIILLIYLQHYNKKDDKDKNEKHYKRFYSYGPIYKYLFHIFYFYYNQYT